MEYNWADPKKNNKLSSLLMTKAEASRKKRLTSVRSTLSNQLHPSVESKLRKKKRAGPVVSARRDVEPVGRSDGKNEESQQGDNNSPHHPCGSSSRGRSRLEQQPPRPESDHETSMFDAFDLNAAADGLFHPASAISAFIEHDAKYHAAPPDAKAGVKRGKSSSKAPTMGGDDAEALAVGDSPGADLGAVCRAKELPALSGRGSASSQRLLHTRGSSRSSSASSFASSASGSRESTATRSDSDLLMLAPRRLGAIPSSADRSALDFYEHDEGESESDGDQGQQQVPEGGGGAFDLATKFAALKDMFNQNQASKSGHGGAEQPPSGSAEGAASLQCPPSSVKAVCSSGPTVSIGGSKHGRGSRSPAGKAGAPASTKTTGVAAASAARQARAIKPAAASTREAKAATKAPAAAESAQGCRDGGSAGDRKPRQKEGKVPRSGMSLTDLQEEHRAALALLQELGGPTDAEFHDEDMDRSIRLLAARSGKSVGPAAGRLSGARVAAQGKALAQHAHSASKTAASALQQCAVEVAYQPELHEQQQQQQQRSVEPEEDHDSENESPLRPLSSSSSGSLVSRLRSSVALGRVTCRERVARSGSDESEGDEGRDSDDEAEQASRSLVSPHASDINGNQSASEGASRSAAATVHGGVAAGGAAELPWEQYCATFDELGTVEGEDGGGESSADEAEDGAAGASRSVDHRYSDDGFEADW